MKFERMKREAASLEIALDRISRNGAVSYEWYAVKNKKDYLIEVGGCKKDGKLEFKAYIPRFESGKYVVYPNGYTNSAYSLNNEGYIEFSTFRDIHGMDEQNLIKFLDNTDFKTYRPKIEVEEVVEYSEVCKVKM